MRRVIRTCAVSIYSRKIFEAFVDGSKFIPVERHGLALEEAFDEEDDNGED
jgi:hypothetical protein